MSRRRAVSDRFNWLAFAIIMTLAAVSLMSQRNADWYSGDQFYDLQMVWYLIGGVCFVFASVINLRLLERSSYFIYGLCIVGLILTRLVGTEVNNAQRWLRFGPVNMQVSELMKLGVILALAKYFHAQKERVPGEPQKHEGPYRLLELGRPFLLFVIPAAMILLQPDLGTALLLSLVAVTMILYEGVHRRGLILLCVCG